MSYIVKNCMCAYGFVNEPMYCLWKDEVPIYKTLCQDCTDCVLKQVIENCKEVENIENVKTLYDAAQSGMFLQANRILKLLDIEEVRE